MSGNWDDVPIEDVNIVIEFSSSKLLHKMECMHNLTSCSWPPLAIVDSVIVGSGFRELGGCCSHRGCKLSN